MSQHRSSGKAAGGLLAAAAATIGVMASLGAGYTVAHAALSDGSAYVTKGTALSHVNGVARRPDATSKGALAKQGQNVVAVALPGNKVAAVNDDTGVLTTIDGATMSPTATVVPTTAGKPHTPVRVVASGSGGWMVDHDGSAVRRIVDGQPQSLIKLQSAPIDAAPGPAGSIIVLGEDGHLVRVETDGSVHKIATDDALGGALTVAGGHTDLVTTAGAVIQVDGAAPETVATVPGVAPGPNGRMVVGSIEGAGAHVLIVTSDGLAIADPGTGNPQIIGLHSGSRALGQPVEFEGHVYIPDYTNHRVLVVDEHTPLSLGTPLKVPGHRATFSLFVSGGRVWANDQYAQHMLELDSSGTHQVDKGPGNGVHDDVPPSKASTKQTHRAPQLPSFPSSVPSGGSHSQPSSHHGSSPAAVPSNAPVKQVTLPSFPAGTNYQDACAQIEALGPACQGVGAGSDHSGATDDVIQTVPSEGSKVPVTAQVTVQYIGPTAVPNIFNQTTTPADECNAITAANLTCNPQPSPTPATDPVQFGFVSALDPPSGQQVGKDTKITVYYYDSFPMPDIVAADTSGTTACAQIEALPPLTLPNATPVGPTCTAPAGPSPTNDPNKVGKVYAQTPATTTQVHATDAVTLTVFNGTHDLPDYGSMQDPQDGAHLTFAAAQQDCLQWFAGCDQATGDPAANHIQDIGRVQKTDPGGPQSALPVGSHVTIYVFGGQNTVPDVTGQPIGTACTNIQNAGYVCDPNSNHPLAKTIGVANPPGTAQSPAGGSAQNLGITVVVPNAVLAPVELDAYPNPTDPEVFAIRTAGTVPTGYTPGTGVPIGVGYAPGALAALGPDNWQIHEFTCGCDGHNPNHVTSHGGTLGAPWSGGTAIADLMPPSATDTCGQYPGQIALWRVSDFHGGNAGNHTYRVVQSATRPTSDYTEMLGCGWQ